MARIFISHSSHNNDRAIQLRDWLAANGWDDVFLDLDPERGIAAGERWKEALQKAAQRCEAILALLSPEWLASAWCRPELNAAQLLGKKIIVLLIGSKPSEVPSDLKDEQYVDLINDPDAYTRLKEGLKRAGLDPASFPFAEGRRPYPGFPPLEEEDAAIFFGRDGQIVRGLDKLRGMARAGVERMLIILGASGSGKSSFLRAGLWPRLRRDDRSWLLLPTIRPERAAISGKFGLVEALYRIMNEAPFAKKLQQQDLPRSRADIEQFVTTREDGLPKILVALREAGRVPGLAGEETPPPTIVIPIDQSEELFTQEGRAEAKRFIDILAKTLEADRRVLALLTMRTDSFARFQNDPVLAALPKDTFTLDRMLEGSYRAVIEGPAALVKPTPLKIDPQLTDALLQDVTGQDALPLLAFTLRHLYDQYQANNELNLDGYERLGRLKGVIETTVKQAIADGVAKGELPKDEKDQLALIRKAFIPHLARVNAAGQFVRRVATRAEIPPEARPLIDRFAEARLLIKDRRAKDGKEEEIIEVAHEALLREWKGLNTALLEEREFLIAKGQLEQVVEEYGKTAEDQKKGALLTGNNLSRARDWLVKRPQDLTAEERQFIQASADAEDERRNRELAEARKLAEAEKQIARRTRLGLIVACILAIAAFGAAGFGFYKENEARQQTLVAKTNESRLLAGLAGQATKDHSPTTGMLLALEGLPDKNARDPTQRERPVVSEAETAAYEALWQTRGLAIVGSNPGGQAVTFSTDGTQLVAIEARSKTARVSNVETGAEIAILGRDDHYLNSVAFSPDGTKVVTASGKAAQIWDAKTGTQLNVLAGHQNWVNSATYSPDGTRILTASDDLTARLWNAQSGEPIAALTAYKSDDGRHSLWKNAAFSPDGDRILTWEDEGVSPQLWDGKTGKWLAKLEGHKRGVTCIAFSPDGALLVTGTGSNSNDFDHTARLWDAKTGKQLAILEGQANGVRTVGFSRDSSLIVGTAQDDAAKLWDIRKVTSLAEPDHSTEAVHLTPTYVLAPRPGLVVVDAQFSPDGTRVVIAHNRDEDHTASVWDAKTGKPLELLRGHQGPLKSARFSPDGKFVVTAAGSESVGPKDNTARLWDVSTGRQLAVLKGHEAEVESASFSPDGKRVVTIGSRFACPSNTAPCDNTVRLWDASHLWDANAGGSVTIFKSEESDVGTAAFNSDRTRILTVGYFAAKLWDAKTGAAVARLRSDAKEDYSGCVASFSPDGTRVVTAASDSGSPDKAVTLWNAETGAKVAILKGQEDNYLSHAKFSPDGKLIVTASGKTAQIWDAKTGRQLKVLAGHQGPINSASFSPDGKFIITAASTDIEPGSPEDNTARLWDASTGAQLAVLTGHEGKVESASFSADGTRIVTVAFDGTRLWNAETHTQIAALSHTRGSALLSPDGKEVITGAPGDEAQLWDAKTGGKITVFENHRGDVDDGEVTFSSDGALLLVSEENIARVWDARTGSLIATLAGHDGPVSHAVFSPDGSQVVTSARTTTTAIDNTARLWDARTGGQIAVLSGHDSPAQSVAFSPDGKWVLTASNDKTARLWPVFPNLQGLVDHAKKSVPRCLTPAERKSAFLDPVPPHWCIEMNKWPYNCQAWSDWLKAKDAGKNPALPMSCNNG